MAADRGGWPAQLWRGTRTIRVRVTAAALMAVALALAVGAVALVTVLRAELTREIEAAARVRAQEVAAALETGTRPADLPVGDAEETLVQVVAADGRVLASSRNVAGAGPVARLPPGGSARVAVPVDDDRFLAVAAGADTPNGPVTVLVARSVDAVSRSSGIVTALLAGGLPVLLLVIGAITWRVVGRTLAPVETIRAEVDAISPAELHRRVPDPPGDDEVGRLARTMNRMLDRLERAQLRQRRLVSDASHELRSPVAALRQHAEVALAHPERTTTDELARTVLDESLRVQDLVEDLLLLARFDEDSVRLRRRPVDLDDLVFDEARRLRATTALRVDTTAVSAGRVVGDVAVLRRVLRNLTDNAARFARGRVGFALSEQDGVTLLAVDDDGPGIPAADRERVLERFVRLDGSRARSGGGSGLGLAIVTELVTAHGGTVTVRASPDGGARVEIRLPADGTAAG